MQNATNPVLQLERISKSYPGVVALDQVNLTVHRNEMVGLVGENGAGKSTLMKIMIGWIQPDSGLYRLRGAGVTIEKSFARDAARSGDGLSGRIACTKSLDHGEPVSLPRDRIPEVRTPFSASDAQNGRVGALNGEGHF